MTPSALSKLIKDVNADIVRMTRASQIQSEVRAAIRHRADSPLEEQLIDQDAFGLPRGEPRQVEIDGITLKIWKIHRTGLLAADIKGADLYYEISDRKFVLVQYKTPNRQSRVTRDNEQLTELKGSCPNNCNPTVRFSCGAWFALRGGKADIYLPACEAERIFGGFASRKSSAFINGLTKAQFQTEFGSCNIGGRTKPVDISNYQSIATNFDHIFFRVEQVPPNNEQPRSGA